MRNALREGIHKLSRTPRLEALENRHLLAGVMSYSFETLNGAGELTDVFQVGDTIRVNVLVQDCQAFPSGVAQASLDLGLDNLDLVTFQRPGDFNSGVVYGNHFNSGGNTFEGGGIQLNGIPDPLVADGEIFDIELAGDQTTFEFDRDSSFTPGNIPVVLNALPAVLTHAEVRAAIIAAIGGSGLGLDPADNGSDVVGLHNPDAVFNPGTSQLTPSLTFDEYFNETVAIAENIPADPGAPVNVFTIDFLAEQPGVLTFLPNQPDRPESDNFLFPPFNPVPPNLIDFGNPFSITIFDPSPQAVDDEVLAQEDTDLELIGANVDLLINDVLTNPPVNIVSIDPIGGVTVGEIAGSTYSPLTDFFGQDLLTYTIENAQGFQSTATITIQVQPVNDPPLAVDDLIRVGEETRNIPLDVLFNDSGGPNEPNDPFVIESVTVPDQGGEVMVAPTGDVLLYSPAFEFLGLETFDYTIRDAAGETATATVRVDVFQTITPRAISDNVSIFEDSGDNTIDVLINDRAHVGEEMTLVGISENPSHGAIRIDDNQTPLDPTDDRVIYTPDPDFVGEDGFLYAANDTLGSGPNSEGMVTIMVLNTNEPPDLTDDEFTTQEDETLLIDISSVLQNDSAGTGEDNQTLTLDSVAPLNAGANVEISGSQLVVSPETDFNGTFFFEYTATDDGTVPGPLSSTATVTINVQPVNDDPIAGDDQLAAMEDVVLDIPFADLLINDTAGPLTAVDEFSQILQFVSADALSALGSTIVLNANSLSLSPPSDLSGADEFTYTVSDGAGGLTTGTVSVQIAPVNDAPVTTLDELTTPRNTSISIPLSDLTSNDSAGPADEAGQTLTITDAFGGPLTDGTVVFSSTEILFTPALDFVGTTTFQYAVEDNGATGGLNQNSSVGDVSIEVTQTNLPPELQDDELQISEDITTTISATTLFANDSPGPGESTQTLTLIEAASLDGNATVTLLGNEIVFDPNQDVNGPLLFSYTAVDDGQPNPLQATATVTVDVAPVNDPPIASDDQVDATEDTTLLISISGLLSNDSPGPATATDEQSQILALDDFSQPSSAGGALTQNGTDLQYAPPLDFFGMDSFTYVVNDGAGGTGIGTVTINVAPVNDPPIPGPVGGETFFGLENTTVTISIAEILVNDLPGPSNEDNQQLSLINVSEGPATRGQVSLVAGEVLFEPESDFVGTTTFNYTLQDDGLGTDSTVGVVNVSIAAQFGDVVGEVFQDLNGDGVRQASELGLADAGLFLDVNQDGIASPGEQQTQSTAAGQYRFENIPLGTYQVLPLGSRDQAQTTDTPNAITLIAGQETFGGDFGFYPLTSLSGRVFGDRNVDSELNADEHLKPLWPVTLTDGQGLPVTNALDEVLGTPRYDGSFFFDGLLPNGVTIRTPGGGSITAPMEYRVQPEILPGYELTTQLETLFAGGEFIATGSLGGNIAVGDVNRDGLPDLIVANDFASQAQGTSGLTLLTNSATMPGTFSGTAIPLPDGSRPQHVDLLDINQDGALDIVLALVGSPAPGQVNQHGIYFIPNVQDTFDFDRGRYLVDSRSPDPSPELIQVQLAQGTEPRFASSLDQLRSDGPTDFVFQSLSPGAPPALVITNQRSDNVLIDDQAGNQSFLEIGLDPLAIASEDLDGDDVADLVFAHFDGFIDILLSTTGELITSDIGNQGPTDLHLRDVDGDGDFDVLTNNWSTGSVFVLELAAGRVVATHELKSPDGPGVRSLAFANVNGLSQSEFPDIIATNEVTGSATVWINQLGEGFLQGETFPFPVALPDPNPFGLGVRYSISPQQIISADFNADGLPDYAVANRVGGVSLHHNNGGAITISDFGVADPRSFDFGFVAIDIVGQKWEDTNANGQIDGGEQPIADTVIYVDLNRNATRDANEPHTRSDMNGFYSIPLDAQGTFDLREEIPDGTEQSFPGAANNFAHSVTLTGQPRFDAQQLLGFNFGNRLINTGNGQAAGGEGYNNAANAFDVNNDGFITPLDALLVINEINMRNRSSLDRAAEGESATASLLFWDVNADQFLSSIDVLLVVNELNRKGEGESDPRPTLLEPAWVDAFLLDEEERRRKQGGV